MQLKFWKWKIWTFWKKKSRDLERFAGVSRKLVWYFPTEVLEIFDCYEQQGVLFWEFDGNQYEANVQAAPFMSDEGMVYHVRSTEGYTFNPFLQVDFDPETWEKYKLVAEEYYRERGVVFKKAGLIDIQQNGPRISSGVAGSLGNDRSEQDFFSAERMSKWTYILIAAAGVGVWEGLQNLLVTIGANF